MIIGHTLFLEATVSLKNIALLQLPAWNQDKEPFYHVLNKPHLCPLPWKKSIKDKELSPEDWVLESRPSSMLNQLLWVLGSFRDSSEFVFFL